MRERRWRDARACGAAAADPPYSFCCDVAPSCFERNARRGWRYARQKTFISMRDLINAAMSARRCRVMIPAPAKRTYGTEFSAAKNTAALSVAAAAAARAGVFALEFEESPQSGGHDAACAARAVRPPDAQTPGSATLRPFSPALTRVRVADSHCWRDAVRASNRAVACPVRPAAVAAAFAARLMPAAHPRFCRCHAISTAMLFFSRLLRFSYHRI